MVVENLLHSEDICMAVPPGGIPYGSEGLLSCETGCHISCRRIQIILCIIILHMVSKKLV
jgi:hypothetical protein